MSDSDDDLLELAGIGSDEESDYGPQVSKTKRGTSKKRNISNSDYEDNDDEDEDENMGELKPEEDPYPLEGKYRDEEDKMKLMQMDEVSREGILYDRIQEKERFRERRFLALRARQSKVESKSIKIGSSSKKLRTSKLSELKRQRERKSNKDSRKTRAQDDYMDEEEDYDDDEDLRELAGYGEEDEEDYYSDEYESGRKSSRSKNDHSAEFQDASLEDINNKIRSSRNVLEKFLYRDEFDVCIPGTIVRVNVGPSRTTNQLQYRMALVEEIRRGGKPYKLLGKLCDTYLKVSQGDSATVVDISCLSNSPVTVEEFEMYKKRISTSADHSLPTVRYVEDKFTELKAMASKRLTDNDINRMIARKEELSIYNMNTATRVRKLGRLREELQVALEQGDEKVSKSLQEQIDNLSKSFQTAKNTSKLEQINIRNQKSNQEFIRKAEKKLVETKRKQLRNNDFSDPFSRLRTNPKVFYKSVEKQDDNIQKVKDKVDEKEEKNKIKNSIFRRDGIDALIKTIDIDFDFQN